MAIVTIGIPAHVDAGKTTLTARLLDAAGSCQLNERNVNLIETPGRAAAERSPRVLDAVLVVSAVEGVPAQTRRLVRVVRAAGLPLLILVNTVDRLGARGATGRGPCADFGH
jgi:ribosomal protection tetracycline resistance protein